MANRTEKVALKVKRRSGFDKSHFNLFTSLPGKITPIMLDEVIANTKINLRINVAATMPPLVTDCYMKTDLCVEAFFIPMRLLCKSFESWFTQQDKSSYNVGAVNFVAGFLPVANIHLGNDEGGEGISKFFGIRGLPDYLGYRSSAYSASDIKINPLPFVAYHLVWQEWYRRQDVQSPCFVDGVEVADLIGGDPYVASLIPSFYFNSTNYLLSEGTSPASEIAYWNLADGVNLFELRSRNFDSDYFTNALPRPQVGNGESVQVVGNSFTIASLRAANSLQLFQEKNALAGTRFQDTLKVRYGANLSDGLAQRPVLLGAARYNVYNKGIYTNSNMGENSGIQGDTNPFGRSAGAQYGVAQASGSDFIIDGFTANEPGYILVNCTLVPTVTYSSGCSRALIRYRKGAGSLAEMANPLLENTGNQPIYQSELNGKILEDDDYVFGYTDRYADFKDAYDEIHGLFRNGMPLMYFVSQRFFGDNDHPTINDSFLKIPVDYLDPVLTYAKDGSTAGATRFGYWAQVGFDYKVSMPLSEYSMPSLQDPAYEHGDTIVVHRGGFHF